MNPQFPEAWPADARQFATTQWCMVRSAAGQGTHAQESLSRLCQTYWYPLYAFVRRHGYGPDDAEDLTQAFFAHLLEHQVLTKVDPAKGKFRSFLLASLRHFMANERDRAQSAKRGSGRSCVSLDITTAEQRYALEASDNNTPDKVFERNWVLALMEQALRHLRTEQEMAGKRQQFDRLLESLMGDPDAPRYSELSAELGMSVDALKKVVSRLRGRYRELLRQEVARTASDSAEVEEEFHYLIALLQN